MTVTSAEAANSPLQIPVTLTVEAAPALQSNPQSLSFAHQALNPSTPPDQTLIVTTSNGTSATVTSTSSGGSWLSVQPTGSAPGTLQVSVNPSGLTAGSYGGTIALTANGYQPETVPVTLTVTRAPVLNVLPPALTFAYQEGGSLPLAQPVSVTSSPAGIPFSVSVSDTWLHAAGGGSTPSTISVSVDPKNLTPGPYRGSVTVTSSQAGNSPVVVQVDLIVTTAPVITASPGSLHFAYSQLGTVPPSQPVAIDSGSGKPLDFATSVSSGTPWLSVTPGGTTPLVISVSLDPTGLNPGDHTGSVLIQAAGASNSPLTIPVTVTVTAAPLIQANPSQFTFAYQAGWKRPTAQALTVTSSGASVPVSAATSGESWLSLAGAGGLHPDGRWL